MQGLHGWRGSGLLALHISLTRLSRCLGFHFPKRHCGEIDRGGRMWQMGL